VRGQHWEVNRGDPTCVARGFFTDVRVVSDVANQETGRRDDGDDHTRHMTPPCAVPDEIPAHRNEDGANQI